MSNESIHYPNSCRSQAMSDDYHSKENFIVINDIWLDLIAVDAHESERERQQRPRESVNQQRQRVENFFFFTVLSLSLL